jgi:hypothetical protein
MNNFEVFLEEYKKQAPIKIQYYLNLFLDKGINEDTVTEFLSDNSFCCFTGIGWMCPVCSHGCFKINIKWEMEKDKRFTKKDKDDLFRLECKLSAEHKNEK